MVPSFAWMSAEAVADETVRAVGRQTVLVNGMLNRVLAAGMRLAPRRLIARTMVRSNQRAAGQSGTST
jgi:short-subunit dehydrogenase